VEENKIMEQFTRRVAGQTLEFSNNSSEDSDFRKKKVNCNNQPEYSINEAFG